jgi:hypothetical protein
MLLLSHRANFLRQFCAYMSAHWATASYAAWSCDRAVHMRVTMSTSYGVSNDISRCHSVRLMRINFLVHRLGLEVIWATDLRSPRSMARAMRSLIGDGGRRAWSGCGRRWWPRVCVIIPGVARYTTAECRHWGDDNPISMLTVRQEPF